LAAATKEHTKEIFSASSGASFIVDAFETVLVVLFALLDVTENLIGSRDFLELVLFSACNI
jgi:hypothetical protein